MGGGYGISFEQFPGEGVSRRFPHMGKGASLCTLAPEENGEGILHVLACGVAELLPWEPPVPHERGLISFGAKECGSEMQKPVRIYPYHFDSEGGIHWGPAPNFLRRSRQFRRAFGVEEYPGRLVFRPEAFWLTTAPEIPEGLRVRAVGVRLADPTPWFQARGFWAYGPGEAGEGPADGGLPRGAVEASFGPVA